MTEKFTHYRIVSTPKRIEKTLEQFQILGWKIIEQEPLGESFIYVLAWDNSQGEPIIPPED